MLWLQGWNHWNAFHCNVNERLVMATADAMAASGLFQYEDAARYLNLDDCIFAGRDANGTLVIDPARFPSGLPALVSYVHSRGLRFGIYQAPALTTPQGRPGLQGHEAQDVATFCAAGVTYLKLDAKGSTRAKLQLVRRALATCPHPIYLQVAFCKSVAACRGWMDHLANAWRTSGDAQSTFASVLGNLDATEPLWPLAGPDGPIGGHWNDADLLEVGNVGLSIDEMRTQVSLWSIINSPLLMSNDLRTLTRDNATLALLTNAGILSLNQDPLGYAGRRVASAAPPAPTPSGAITVEPCDATAKSQTWVHDGSSGHIVHVPTGRALTIVNCTSVPIGQGHGATLALLPSGGRSQGACAGRNQMWQLRSNGTVTSAMDGSCLDVWHDRNPVQSHACVAPHGAVPQSELWHVRDRPSGGVEFRWGAQMDHCLQAAEKLAVTKAAAAPSVYEKQLSNGDVALLLLNRGVEATNVTVDLAAVKGLGGGGAALQDVWSGQPSGMVRGLLTRVVRGHGAVVLRAKPLQRG